MTEPKYLTPEEVSDRYRGAISTGTLKNWRSQRIGPPFIKVGKSVLYSAEQLDQWDRKNVVTCRASKVSRMTTGDQR